MKDFLREPLKRPANPYKEKNPSDFRKRQTFHWKKKEMQRLAAGTFHGKPF